MRAAREFPGVSPRGALRANGEACQKAGEDRATPGGYGGKPPGVAIIGVPTGARNAGSGAPTGDQSTDMNGTRASPCMCQDLKTVKSRNAIPATPLPSRSASSVVNCTATDRRLFQACIRIAFKRMHSVFAGRRMRALDEQNVTKGG